METAAQKQNEKMQEDFIETEPYMFAPSINKRRTMGGKTYYVRSYFNGEKDFEKTMERLAVRHTYKNAG